MMKIIDLYNVVDSGGTVTFKVKFEKTSLFGLKKKAIVYDLWISNSMWMKKYTYFNGTNKTVDYDFNYIIKAYATLNKVKALTDKPWYMEH